MDKEQRMAADLDDAERPINQHWSWDRILRSVYIEQADTLQGFYFFEDEFDEATHRENFVSPGRSREQPEPLRPRGPRGQAGHGRQGRGNSASARLDLDDYNREAY